MDFSFDYTIQGTVAKIKVSVEDKIASLATQFGMDVAKMEAEIKAAIDGVMAKVKPGFFQRIEDEVMNVVHEVESFFESDAPAADPATPAPVAPAAPAAPAATPTK